MVFNSLVFALFLPVVFLLFHRVGEERRWLVLLVASLVFYGTWQSPHLLIVLLLAAMISFRCGLAMACSADSVYRRRLLWFGSGANLLLLVGVKIIPLTDFARTGYTSLVLTIGVSYFVFQAISYLADIYLEILDPEPHFGRFLLFMAFFPKLLQGPIERGRDLLPQLRSLGGFDYDVARTGLHLFAWGLFKKVVVADRLGLFVDSVYGQVGAHSGLPLLVATYFYAFQIYFDFSGYTDMALGVARLFNIRLTQNFNNPYAATSVADFWRRWHISFSRWILDYIFKPLQMQWREWRNFGTALALLVTFILSGLWHGLSWGFLVWGMLHGLFLASSVYYRPLQKRLHKALGVEKAWWLGFWQILVTFHLVGFAWIFFRAATVGDAIYVVSHLFDGIGSQLAALGSKESVRQWIYLGQGSHQFIVAVLGVVAGLALPRLADRFPLDRRPRIWRWAFYYFAVSIIIYYGVFDVQTRFIYFQF